MMMYLVQTGFQIQSEIRTRIEVEQSWKSLYSVISLKLSFWNSRIIRVYLELGIAYLGDNSI